jgi:hypothetical protein
MEITPNQNILVGATYRYIDGDLIWHTKDRFTGYYIQHQYKSMD